VVLAQSSVLVMHFEMTGIRSVAFAICVLFASTAVQAAPEV